MKKYAITFDGMDDDGVMIIEAESIEDALIIAKFGVPNRRNEETNEIEPASFKEMLADAKFEWDAVREEFADTEDDTRWILISIGDFIEYDQSGGGECDIFISAICLDDGKIEWITQSRNSRKEILSRYDEEQAANEAED